MSGYADRYFLPDGSFRSPELAAEHVLLVQGGFSSPAIEAERMIADGGLGGLVARAWLAERTPLPGDAKTDASRGY